jgi:NADPH-dependent 2,4-dienoyl-CoA reductase/sulfur reductase-like enzyme
MTSSPRVIIIGGVAGGMSCATRLRRLDEHARITVFEKGPYVSYANCGIPYALGGVIADRDRLLLQTPESFKARFNVDVYVNTEVMAIDRDKKVVRVRKVPGEVGKDWFKGEGEVIGVSGDGVDEGEERRGDSATVGEGGVGEEREVG